MRRLEIKSY